MQESFYSVLYNFCMPIFKMITRGKSRRLEFKGILH